MGAGSFYESRTETPEKSNLAWLVDLIAWPNAAPGARRKFQVATNVPRRRWPFAASCVSMGAGSFHETRTGAWPAFSLRLLVLTRLIVRVLRCGGADWCGLVLGRVESWVRALGFPPFSLSPDPPDLLELLIKI